MIELPKVDAWRINAFEHQHGEDGAPALDVIATEHYERTYVAQQTGDMISNDSWVDYVMDKAGVEQALFDGLAIIPGELGQGNTYLGGRAGLNHWLGLNLADFQYDFQAYRQAPTPEVILADLIDKGILPYGRYLMHCWW